MDACWEETGVAALYVWLFMQDAMIIGADYYESEDARAKLFAEGRVPIGVGENSVVSNTIVDKNARIGKDCRIINQVQLFGGLPYELM